MSEETSTTSETQQRIDAVRAMMTEDLFEEMLKEKAGIDAADLATVLNVVAIGITGSSWRNSCIENWHAEGRLSDGDMLRINSHTTHGVRQRLRRWTRELRVVASTNDGLAELTAEDANTVAYRIFRWLTNPKRKLPTGTTLGELAGRPEDLEEYVEHADRSLGAFVGQMEVRGVRYGLLYTATHGALAGNHWWGHPA
ncbi:hypothetical protein ACFU6K_03095 [Kitasatospora sp. NPDC057512]|uniref:hypothetical protein n=1 Tax=Kitasatospora sp. NPDC057512 TaxID=3346154 RepID=UPI0036C5DCB7